jgi:hypothetical protein|tara:strand:+ start:249 stop:434 length:186 start_codon:yes stop_codon:yes gene_type:complete
MKKFKTITIQFKDEPLNFNYKSKSGTKKENIKLIKKVSELISKDINSYSEFHDNEIVIKLF